MNNDSVEDRLRDALLRSTTELNNYRQLYRQSQKENQSLRTIARDLEIQNQCLNQTNLNLYRRSSIKNDVIKQLEGNLLQVKIPKFRKKVSEIKSKSQISRRKQIYKKCITKAIKRIPEASAANVSIDIGSEWFSMQISKADLEKSDLSTQDAMNARNVVTDHPYSSATDNVVPEEDEPSSESDNEAVFVGNGKISQRHKRCVAHVMDFHKISERAYHELRLSCKGVLPPLSNIHKERLLMSAEIPYVVNPTVSNIFWEFSLYFMPHFQPTIF